MLTTGPGVVEWVEGVLDARYGDFSQGIGWKRDGRFICAAVYEAFNGANVYVHIAKEKGAKFPIAFIAAFVDYPFNQLGCRRMSAAIAGSNAQSIGFARKLGAVQEGLLREATPTGDDLHIFGLLRKDAAKWLTPRYQRYLGEFYGRRDQHRSIRCVGQTLCTASA